MQQLMEACLLSSLAISSCDYNVHEMGSGEDVLLFPFFKLVMVESLREGREETVRLIVSIHTHSLRRGIKSYRMTEGRGSLRV